MVWKISFRPVDRKLRSLIQPNSPSSYYPVRNYTHSPFQNSSDGATAFPWSRQNCPVGQGRWEHISLTNMSYRWIDCLQKLQMMYIISSRWKLCSFKWPLSSTQLHTLSMITSLPEFQWWSGYLTSESTRFPCRPGPLGTHKRLMIPSISASMDCRLSIIVTVSAFTFAPTILKIILVSNSTLEQSPSTPEARRSL